MIVVKISRWLDEGEDDGKLELDLKVTQVIDGDEDPPEGQCLCMRVCSNCCDGVCDQRVIGGC